MDGLKKRLNESIQSKLSFALLLVIAVVAVAAGIFSFLSALDEAHERQDEVLYQVAGLMEQLPAQLVAHSFWTEDEDHDSSIFIQPLARGAEPSSTETGSPTLPIPSALLDGLHTLDIKGQTFRILVKTTSTGERFAVAQDTDQRDEAARDGALRTLTPFLILIPILLIIIADLVRKVFSPIKNLSQEVDARSEQDLQPIENTHLPSEVRPFILAINRLLTRVAESMEAQRRFVADAAHELRSPLTALSLQAERLEQASMSDLARERLAGLRQGIERNRNLLNQLLTFAKAQSAHEQPSTSVSVQGIYRRVLEDLMPLAEARHIDVGVVGEQDAQLWVTELDLLILIKNLVDNAIRYTPEAGRVDLSVTNQQDTVVLSIADSGPGISASERARIFDPFYRVLGSEQIGSGLGLSIVRAIANRTRADITLKYTDETKPTGLTVMLTFSKSN